MSTWDDAVSVDDLVDPQSRVIISDLDTEEQLERDCSEAQQGQQCPYLRRLGMYFHYCGRGIPEGTEFTADPENPVVKAQQEVAELQLFCRTTDNHQKCVYFTGDEPFPGAQD
ncbi:hypothetical protein AUJ68_03815 [Candidatus Woesearchaeota archaeon CG1_02_57_44]|nr:MAG: hypothetical protein AUJ68_03815 [Candidatus Woesearchaeota archaeon CG1_02_57_44]